MSSEYSFKIINGPSRSDLFVAMEYAYEAKFPIRFYLEGDSMPQADSVAFMLDAENIIIHTLQHEDGSGHKFNLEGYMDARVKSNYYAPYKFRAFYNAKARKGHITLTKGL